MSMLTPCPECRRHVRKTETLCPFCEAAVSLSHLPVPVLPRKRLGRAATFAFGASVVGATALVACTDGDDQLGGVTPVYGAPPGGSSFAGSAPSAGSNDPGGGDGGAAYAVYGSPPGGAGFGGELPGPGGGTAGMSGGGVAGTSGAAGAGGAGGAGGEGGDVADGGALAIYGGPPSGAGSI